MALQALQEAPETSVEVVRKHHPLVRLTHWLNIPILLGLGLSGLSIYWASPVYHHPTNALGSEDYFADFGIWVTRHVHLVSHGYAVPDAQGNVPDNAQPAGDWFYNHFSLGTGELSYALNVHWFFAYALMANGLLYWIGLLLGGGYKALLPRRTDLVEALSMQRYYMGLPLAKITRKPWPHPHITTKYNALQRGAYFSMSVFGLLAVGTGWAIHKSAMLSWLSWLFGGYDWARIWHFWIMWVFVAFVIVHVIMVVADGWDTFRSMVTGWSARGTNHGDAE